MTKPQIITRRFIIESLLFINILISYLSLFPEAALLFYLIIPTNIITLTMFLKEKIKDINIYFLPIIALIFFTIFSRNTEYIILFSFVFICSRFEYKSLLKRLWVYSILLLVIFIIIRVPQNMIYIRGDETLRYDLGFINPNILSKYVFSIVILTYLCNMRLFSIFVALCFYKISGTRTLVLAAFLTPLVSFYTNLVASKFRAMQLVITLAFPILTILSIILAKLSREFTFIDVVLSYRPMHWINYLEAYPVKFFGSPFTPLENYVLDSSFLQVLLGLGVFGSAIFSILYYYIFKVLLELRATKILTCILVTFIYGFFENMFKYPLFNVATVLSIVYLINVKKEVK